MILTTLTVINKNFFRYTLGFGEVSELLGYNALKDFFPRSTIKPNPESQSKNIHIIFCTSNQ